MHCQRWEARQHSWRHTSEGGFNPDDYEVALIAGDAPAKAFVRAHHYSGSYPAARIRVGLYEAGELVGVAVFGVPAQRKVLTSVFPALEPYTESIELSRFVLLDRVPANAESWFLARAHSLAAEAGVRGVVAFSDPVPRRTAAGEFVMPGHVGTIYQASNGLFTAERSTPRTLLLGPDGRVLSARSLQKIRRGERGHDYAEAQLVAWGAQPRQGADPRDWLRHALPAARLRRMRHPGNYRYAFRLGRTRAERSRVQIAARSAGYPKKQHETL